MIIPQFSIRWLLIATAVGAVISLIFGLALQGVTAAIIGAGALASCAVLVFVYGLLFLGGRLIANARRRSR